MQIDVIEEVKGTQFMQCKLYIDGNASVILMNKIDYERLLSDSFLCVMVKIGIQPEC